MFFVESLVDRAGVASAQPFRLQRGVDFVGLAAIAHVGGKPHVAITVKTLFLQPVAAGLLHFGEKGGEIRGRPVVHLAIGGADEIILEIGNQAAERGNDTGGGRHHHTFHIQFAGKETGEHRARAAESEEVKFARVDGEAGGQGVHLRIHARDGDIDDVAGERLDGKAEFFGKRQEGGARCGVIDGHCAITERHVADEIGGRHGVRDCRAVAAASVTGRPRRRTGTFRSDLQQAETIHPRDRAAALANGTDGNGGNVNLEIADQLTDPILGLAIKNNGHIGAGAANVQAHHPLKAAGLG
ncbi:hypothetical protein D3C86_1217580 [compost metagenome]